MKLCGWILTLAFSMMVQAQESPDAPILEVTPAFENISLTAWTRARAFVDITAEVSGRCIVATSDIGAVIPKNGMFAQLDDTFAKLDLERNEAEQKRLKNQTDFLKREADRFKRLYEEKTISESNYETALNRYEQTALQLEALLIESKTLKERLDRHRLEAPSGWRVVDRRIEPGQWVAAGTMVGRAGDYRTLAAPFSVDAETLAWLESQKEIPLTLPDGATVSARLGRISPAFDPQTRKIAVELEIKEGIAQRGGLRVSLNIKIPHSGMVFVPRSALSKRYDAWWVTRQDGSELRVRVIGEGEDGAMRVQSGDLKPGDLLRGAAQ